MNFGKNRGYIGNEEVIKTSGFNLTRMNFKNYRFIKLLFRGTYNKDEYLVREWRRTS